MGFTAVLIAIQWVFILITIALVAGFVYSFYKSWRFHPRFDLGGRTTKKLRTLRSAIMQEHWQTILKKVALGTPESMRLALIEADALVDTSLKSIGVPGETLADRLSNLEGEDMKTMDRLWRAHRMRNDLVHTPGFVLSPEESKEALGDYEAFLKELEVL